MSTIKTKNIQHPSAAEPALTLNPDGTFNAAMDDVAAQSLNGSTFSFRNKIINGNFDIWQRGTTFSGSVFTADRWKTNSDGGNSNRVFGPDGITNYGITIANPATYIGQFIELPTTGRAGEFQLGTTWTLSWYQNNTSPALAYMQFRDSDNESAGTNIMYLGNGTAVETFNGWTRYKVTMTFTEAPVSTSACLTCFIGASGQANTQYTGVQFEKGGLTVLEQRPVGVELSLCQRYYQKSYDIDKSPGANSQRGMTNQWGGTDSSGNILACVSFRTEMRTVPTIDTYYPGNDTGMWQWQTSSGSGSVTPTIYRAGTGQFSAYVTTGSNWVPALLQGHWTADAEF